MKVLQLKFGCHCIEKFMGFVFMDSLSGKLWILNQCTFASFVYNINTCIFCWEEAMAVQKYF